MNDWLGSFYCLSFFALRLKTNPIPYTLNPKSKMFFVWIWEFPFYDDGVCLSSGSVSGRKRKIVEFFVIIIKNNNHSTEKPYRCYFDCLLSCFLLFFQTHICHATLEFGSFMEQSSSASFWPASWGKALGLINWTWSLKAGNMFCYK